VYHNEFQFEIRSIQVLPESLRQKAHLPRGRKHPSEIAFLEELGNGIIS
jgi:hypothetical protein